jgi:hypothetical protein
MPLYVCRFCDYNNKDKQAYYLHLYKHINENNASFDKEEIELCTFYHNKIFQYQKNFRQNNKDRICQIKKEYRENNKEQISQRKKEYRENNKEKISQQLKEYRENNKEKISQLKKEYHLRKKLEKQQVEDIDELIIDCD